MPFSSHQVRRNIVISSSVTNVSVRNPNSRNVRHIGKFSGRRASEYTRARIVIYYGSYIYERGKQEGERGKGKGKGGGGTDYIEREPNLMPRRPIVCKCFAV